MKLGGGGEGEEWRCRICPEWRLRRKSEEAWRWRRR
jgi:hypothetical protein